MFHYTVLTFSLFLFWLLLSGLWDNSFLVLMGIVCALFAAWLEKILRQDTLTFDAKFAFLFPTYLVWLAWEIWKANVDTAKRIWLPGKYPISPTLDRLKMTQKTDIGQTVYTNSITITPGTISIDMEDDTVIVHALAAESIEDLKAGEMDRRITQLESKK